MVPPPSPCPAPFTLEPEPSHGATSAAYTVPAMGTAWTLAPGEVLLSAGQLQLSPEESLPAGLVVRRSWSPGPFSGTAQSFPPSDHSRLGSPPESLQAGYSGPVVCRAPSPNHPQTGLHQAAGRACPAPEVVLCGRRAGGKALTLQSLLPPSPVPPPGSLPFPARSPSATPDQWTQAQSGGPFGGPGWVVRRGPGPVTGGLGTEKAWRRPGRPQ